MSQQIYKTIYPSLKVVMLAVDWFTRVHVSCMLLLDLASSG